MHTLICHYTRCYIFHVLNKFFLMCMYLCSLQIFNHYQSRNFLNNDLRNAFTISEWDTVHACLVYYLYAVYDQLQERIDCLQSYSVHPDWFSVFLRKWSRPLKYYVSMGTTQDDKHTEGTELVVLVSVSRSVVLFKHVTGMEVGWLQRLKASKKIIKWI